MVNNELKRVIYWHSPLTNVTVVVILPHRLQRSFNVISNALPLYSHLLLKVHHVHEVLGSW